jgi:hypothetical protein
MRSVAGVIQGRGTRSLMYGECRYMRVLALRSTIYQSCGEVEGVRLYSGRGGVGIDRRCRHSEGDIRNPRASDHARFLISKKREGRISFCSRSDR